MKRAETSTQLNIYAFVARSGVENAATRGSRNQARSRCASKGRDLYVEGVPSALADIFPAFYLVLTMLSLAFLIRFLILALSIHATPFSRDFHCASDLDDASCVYTRWGDQCSTYGWW
jgi:hypothetical protein